MRQGASGGEEAVFRRSRVLVRMRAITVGTETDVPSPCISVCRMSAHSGLCVGCFRTADEIAAWSAASEDGKRGIWTRIEERMSALPT